MCLQSPKVLLLTAIFLILQPIVHGQVCTVLSETITLDYTGMTSQNVGLVQSVCNPQTQIDLIFPQASAGSLALTAVAGVTGGYSFTNGDNGGSTLQFLNFDGKNSSYALKALTLTTYASSAVQTLNIIPTPDYTLTLTYSTGTEDTVVVFYLAASTASINYVNIIPSSNADFSSFRSFINSLSASLSGSPATATVSNLNSLSVFNGIWYGTFWGFMQKTMTPACGYVNYLVNSFIVQVDAGVTTPATGPFTAGAAADPIQLQNGQKLCYGSQIVAGIFQTHLRESWPFWAAWFSVLLFWIFNLIGDSTSISVFDDRFNNNKWTCYGPFSLWHLCHEEFFTRMSRSTLFYTILSCQACVNAILYGELGARITTPETIPWVGAVGWACSLVYSYLVGWFLQRWYRSLLEKYNAKAKIKGLFDKDSAEAQVHESAIDIFEEEIFTSYYWLYWLMFGAWLTFWVVAVWEMQKTRREYYYEHYYWIASLGVSIGIENVLIGPLFSGLCGHLAFWQYRGYWYDFRLGVTFKDTDTS